MPAPLRYLRPLLALLLVLSLAGCVTGYPGAPQGGYGGYPDRGAGARELVGSVDHYDPSSGRLLLAPEGYGGRMEVWVQRGTRTWYRGQAVDAAGLERGDGVRVVVDDDGRRLWARSIEVIRNVREAGPWGGYGDPYGGGYGGMVEGAVRYVDVARGMLEITRGGYSGSVERVYFDGRTRFEYRGQLLRPEQLERGDIVRIQGRPSRDGLLADVVQVTVDARSR